ncbi:unnamed protein product [Coregonus sp. 'balchen']|nr:unnamed protein product [Coregonus sp. 'balchen']
MHPQPQKWVRSDRGNPIELSYPYGSMFNPIAGARQWFGMVPHMLEPNKHQGLIIPKNFTFSYRPDKMPDKVPCVNSPNPTEEKVWVKVEADAVAKTAKRGRTRGPCAVKALGIVPNSVEGRAAGGAGTRKRGGPPVESSQRRERHNSKERDRRRRIRFCCDKLNVLAPFCNHETDKATTLQWTTAFLKYVREVYGGSNRSSRARSVARLVSGSSQEVPQVKSWFARRQQSHEALHRHRSSKYTPTPF